MGKVFPKTGPVGGELDEKLDLFCVGLEKDKDANLTLPAVEQEASQKGSSDADSMAEICVSFLILHATTRDPFTGSFY